MIYETFGIDIPKVFLLCKVKGNQSLKLPLNVKKENTKKLISIQNMTNFI